jgi:hypothetical protein
VATGNPGCRVISEGQRRYGLADFLDGRQRAFALAPADRVRDFIALAGHVRRHQPHVEQARKIGNDPVLAAARRLRIVGKSVRESLVERRAHAIEKQAESVEIARQIAEPFDVASAIARGVVALAIDRRQDVVEQPAEDRFEPVLFERHSSYSAAVTFTLERSGSR